MERYSIDATIALHDNMFGVPRSKVIARQFGSATIAGGHGMGTGSFHYIG